MDMMDCISMEGGLLPGRHFGSDLHQLSHDLRTPLNAINGFAELLLMDGALSDGQADYVRAILVGGQALEAAVTSCLSRVEAGPALSAEARPMPRRSLFKQARRMHGPRPMVCARRMGLK